MERITTWADSNVVARDTGLGGGNQRPQFPAPQTPHPPSLFLFRGGNRGLADGRSSAFIRLSEAEDKVLGEAVVDL